MQVQFNPEFAVRSVERFPANGLSVAKVAKQLAADGIRFSHAPDRRGSFRVIRTWIVRENDPVTGSSMGRSNGTGQTTATSAPLDHVFEMKRRNDQLLNSPPDLGAERIGSLALTLGLLAGLVAVYAHVIAIAAILRLAVAEHTPWIARAPVAPNASDYVNAVSGIVMMLGCVWIGLRSRRLANTVIAVTYGVWLLLALVYYLVIRSLPNFWPILVGGAMGVLAARFTELPKPPTPGTDDRIIDRIAQEVRAVGTMRLLFFNAVFLASCACMGGITSFAVGILCPETPWAARLVDETESVEILRRDPDGYLVKRAPKQLEWRAASEVTRISPP